MGSTAAFWEIALRLVLAALAGGVLGWERERRQKPAGLRTHMMVSLGAAIFIAISLRMMQILEEQRGDLQYDPLRVLQGIIGGVGFLGAGAIIQSGRNVRGITTAASIWLAAAIGVTCGVGLYDIAGLSVALGFLILKGVGKFEVHMLDSEDDEAKESPDS